jgi:hypothetical protein
MTDEDWDKACSRILREYCEATGATSGAFYLVALDAPARYLVTDAEFEKELRTRLDSNVSDPATTKLVIL